MYYLNVAKEFFKKTSSEEEEFIPMQIERKRLDSLIFSRDYGQDILADFGLVQETDELELVRMNANSGKTSSIIKLAYWYYYGLKGLERNYEQAFELLSQAAYLGDNSAKSSLGYLYLRGIGTEKKTAKAFELFMEAAQKKDDRALNGLGYMYLNGLHVEPDENMAFTYFKRMNIIP